MDLSLCIQETVDDIQQIFSNHRVIVSGSIKSTFFGDRERISQVIINLLSNAAKYSPNNNKIRVKLQEETDSFRISVTDYGMGISRKNLSKVFERFYREEIKGKNIPGLGMGLYISQQIALAHGGEITAKSTVRHGSTFTLYLPKNW